jgi:hypothetical protein
MRPTATSPSARKKASLGLATHVTPSKINFSLSQVPLFVDPLSTRTVQQVSSGRQPTVLVKYDRRAHPASGTICGYRPADNQSGYPSSIQQERIRSCIRIAPLTTLTDSARGHKQLDGCCPVEVLTPTEFPSFSKRVFRNWLDRETCPFTLATAP